METLPFNRNEKQLTFNQIRGFIIEMNDGDEWCSFTLNCGHEQMRPVNLCIKKAQYDKIKDNYRLGDKIEVRYYLTSRFKNNRWYSQGNILQVDHCV